mmetsp:Transcript_122698/g.281291  ORF Transcript_122698/g.281291 Transcript_122698/m.281291 type:complete len:266 (+) Transcript_122698:251-1048(+)
MGAPPGAALRAASSFPPAGGGGAVLRQRGGGGVEQGVLLPVRRQAQVQRRLVHQAAQVQGVQGQQAGVRLRRYYSPQAGVEGGGGGGGRRRQRLGAPVEHLGLLQQGAQVAEQGQARHRRGALGRVVVPGAQGGDEAGRGFLERVRLVGLVVSSGWVGGVCGGKVVLAHESGRKTVQLGPGLIEMVQVLRPGRLPLHSRGVHAEFRRFFWRESTTPKASAPFQIPLGRLTRHVFFWRDCRVSIGWSLELLVVPLLEVASHLNHAT